MDVVFRGIVGGGVLDGEGKFEKVQVVRKGNV
jgi:hypothetical protein